VTEKKLEKEEKAQDPKDIRWKQRFANYNKALAQLTAAIELGKTRPLSELERQGLIKAYEFTYELAWNVMKDYFAFQGTFAISGSRDAIREAFKNGLIESDDIWMGMLRDRNKTSHTYNEAVATEITRNIVNSYYSMLVVFQTKMRELEDVN
jgi:nucleotidyltransferase substrate binding protein (TIGR01987 family)